jgi:hypothetical protein
VSADDRGSLAAQLADAAARHAKAGCDACTPHVRLRFLCADGALLPVDCRACTDGTFTYKARQQAQRSAAQRSRCCVRARASEGAPLSWSWGFALRQRRHQRASLAEAARVHTHNAAQMLVDATEPDAVENSLRNFLLSTSARARLFCDALFAHFGVVPLR